MGLPQKLVNTINNDTKTASGPRRGAAVVRAVRGRRAGLGVVLYTVFSCFYSLHLHVFGQNPARCLVETITLIEIIMFVRFIRVLKHHFLKCKCARLKTESILHFQTQFDKTHSLALLLPG